MARNPFQPAEKVEKKLKVMVYGESGVGKTHFALTFPGRVAVIDLEGGTELYGGREDIPSFDVLRTKTYEDVMSALDFIDRDRGKTYQTVVVDPITVLWQVEIDAASKVRSLSTSDGGINSRGWGVIKNRINALYARLTNLPVHVVVTSRLKDEYETKGGDLVKVGVKPDAEKSTPYLFDITLHMTRSAAGLRRSLVEKDRSGTLPDYIDDASYADLETVASKYVGGTPVERQSDGDAAEQTARQMEAQEREATMNAHNGNGQKRGGHWIDNPVVQTKLELFARQQLKLGLDDVAAALSVEQSDNLIGTVRAFEGTMDEAKERLELYADALTNVPPTPASEPSDA